MSRAEDEHPRNVELHRLWRAGDASARGRLIEGNTWAAESTAAWLAGRRGWPGLSREDMVQAGVLGLIGAVGRWEPGRGCYLPGFAARRVRTAILEACGRSATVAVTPRFCRRPRSGWADLPGGAEMVAAQSRRVGPIPTDDPAFGRDCDPAAAVDSRDAVDAMLRLLPPADARCLSLYLGIDGPPVDQGRIGAMFGRSDTWAGARCKAAVETLRRRLAEGRESA